MTEGQTFAAAAIAGFVVGAGAFAVTLFVLRRPIYHRVGEVVAEQAAQALPPELGAAREPVARVLGPLVEATLVEVLP